MADRFSRSQSPRSVPVSHILFHFRCNVGDDALDALEERDADWRRENDDFREEYRTLEADYGHLSIQCRWMEEELSNQACIRRSMEKDIECFEKKERWLEGKVRCLEADVLDLERAKKEEVDMISKEKAVLEAKLHKVSVLLAKQKCLIPTSDVVKKETDDFESAPSRVKPEKKARLEWQGRVERASDSSNRVQDSGRRKKELQGEVCNVKRENSDDLRRILNEKMAVEAEKRRLEDKGKLKIEALEREKADVEAQLRRLESAMSTETERNRRAEEEKADVEAQLRRLESSMSTETERNRRAEEEKADVEAQLRRLESAMSTETERNRRAEEEMKEKIFQLANKCEVLETEKGGVEAELCHAMHEKNILGGLKSRMESELKEKVSELVSRIEVLETEKVEAERILAEKMALQEQMRAAERQVKALELGKKQSKMANQDKQQVINKLLKEKADSEAEKRKLVDERTMAIKGNQGLINIMCKENKTLQHEIERVKEESKKKISDLEKRIDALVAEKETQVLKAKRIDVLCKENTTLQHEIKRVKEESKKKISDLEKRIDALVAEKEKVLKAKRIDVMCKENTTLQHEIKRVKEESKKKISDLEKRIDVLVAEKETQVLKAKADKKIDSERLSIIKEALRDQKSCREKAEKQVSEILKTAGEEKGALRAKVKEMSEEIDVLKRNITELEAELCQIKEKSEEMGMVLKKKKIMEDENKVKLLELTERVEVLMREKREMEAEFSKANKDKSEEMKRILNENIAVLAEKSASEEKASKKSLELANRIGILEREKRGLEEEIVDKDEVIKVVAEENNCLENEIKELKMKLANSLRPSKINKEEVQLSQPVHHPGNVGMMTDTSWQAKGQNPVGACKRKRTKVSKKRKRPFSEGSVVLNSSSGGEIEGTSENRELATWETDEDLLAAFDSDPELCLKALCALYRQHSSFGAGAGFKPGYSAKAVPLAEYLVDDDPERRLRKTVADVEHLDPLIMCECRDIAKQHYKQLFELHSNKKDPFFLS